MLIELSEADIRLAVEQGAERRIGALLAGTHEVYGSASRGDFWTIDIEAVGAEIAAAKAVGVQWSPSATPAEDRALGDLPGGLQVRHTAYPTGSLITHHRDADDHRFILVVGQMPRLRVAGWMLGRDTKASRFWREDMPRPAFFVPQDELRPIGAL